MGTIVPPLHRLVKLGVREGRVTSRGLKHIIPQHLWEEDLMVPDLWFRHIEKVLEAMEITSDAAQIRLEAFQLEGESQVWWDFVKTSKNLEAMT